MDGKSGLVKHMWRQHVLEVGRCVWSVETWIVIEVSVFGQKLEHKRLFRRSASGGHVLRRQVHRLISPTRGHLTNRQSVPSNNQPYADLPPIITHLFAAKARKGLSFEKLAEAIGRDEVWVAAAFYGQTSDLNLFRTSWVLTGGPTAGLGPVPPTDPVIYRLYESVLVYGHAIKSVIHEKFGDGIMSMIDCKINVAKKPDPKGDRVVLTFDGKFLPYAKW
ncbi:cyanate lyase C-terminal domain-containing protein [Boletus coccyginus]|nr:cyanate lyase C-terminal domain-containing protein [Boletus coccyginus]